MIVLRESQAWYHYPYEVNAFDYGGEIQKKNKGLLLLY